MKEELVELVKKCEVENPAPEDVAALRALLAKPETWNDIQPFVQNNINLILDGKAWQAAAREMVKAELAGKRQELGYEAAPMLERLVIDTVLLNWLRWQQWEYFYTGIAQQGVTLEKAMFWEKRLTAAQNRYLKACETLARVRKLARRDPALQVNITQGNGQAVNIAGDLVHPQPNRRNDI